jgi:hypothetical protein
MRSDIDWEAIEREFRLGQFTVRQIAANHGVSHTSITRRAKRLGWARDRSEEVKEKTRAALLSNAPRAKAPESTTPDPVDVAVATNVSLVLEHRVDIRTAREITKTLMGELVEATDNRDEIEEAIEELTARDKNPKRRAMMLRAVALPSRAGVIGALSTSLKTLVGLEREAFNLDADAPPEGAEAIHTIEFVMVDPTTAQ